MRQSSVVRMLTVMALSASAILTVQSPVSAQGGSSISQTTTPSPSLSMKESVGQLKTDTGKTTADVKALDISKTQQDAGQVKKDVQSLEDRAKGMLSHPLGK